MKAMIEQRTNEQLPWGQILGRAPRGAPMHVRRAPIACAVGVDRRTGRRSPKFCKGVRHAVFPVTYSPASGLSGPERHQGLTKGRPGKNSGRVSTIRTFISLAGVCFRPTQLGAAGRICEGFSKDMGRETANRTIDFSAGIGFRPIGPRAAVRISKGGI